MVTRRLRFLIVAITVFALTVSCDETPVPARSTSPTPLSPLPSSPLLQGEVFQQTGEGRRAIAGAHVFVVDLLDGPYGNYMWFQVVSDANGRFAAAAFPGRAVKITAYTGPGFAPLSQGQLVQACGVHPILDGGTRADVELTQADTRPIRWEPPFLSGRVSENTPDGRRPAADMAVLYSSRGHDGADVYTRTDANGHYAFCNVPLGTGYVLPACTRGAPFTPGSRPSTFPVEIAGDTVLNADCP